MRSLTYKILLTKEPEGAYTAVVPALPGCITYGDNVDHAISMAKEAIELYIEKKKEKDKRQRAECTIHVKGGDMFAESADEDLYAAVDALMDKLDRQVGKHKEKTKDHHHDAAKRLM